jgi:hypothetical protein
VPRYLEIVRRAAIRCAAESGDLRGARRIVTALPLFSPQEVA